MGQARNLSITMEKIWKKQDCLFSLTAITGKFNFDFCSEPSLLFHKPSPNHSLVNMYKLLCSTFILSFHSNVSSIVINKFSFYYLLNYNICKMIIWKFLSNLSHFYSSSAVKTVFCTITFSFEKGQIRYLFIDKHNYICEVSKKLWSAVRHL